MELRHLRYFVAVAEELHFGRAAQRLRISQPPLSVQIRDLEHDLGVELFDRSRQRIALTRAGGLALERARALLGDAARLRTDLRAVLEGEAGELRVAFTQSSEFIAFLPEALRQFRDRFPRVELRLQECASQEQIRLIGERRIDVGLARRPRGRLPRRVVAQPLCADPLVLVLRADDPLAAQPAVALADIAERALICLPREEGTGLHDAVVALCQSAGFVPKIEQVASQLLTLIGLVAAGFGVAVVPASLESVRRQGVVFRRIRDPGAWSMLYVLTSAADDSRLTSAFRHILLERVTEPGKVSEVTTQAPHARPGRPTKRPG